LAADPGRAFTVEAVAAAARECFGEPNRRLSTPQELRFGHRGSVSVNVARGVFHDHEAGVGGGVLAMLVHAGCAPTLQAAAQLLESEGQLQPRQTLAERQGRARAEECSLAAKRACAAALWAQAQPLAGTIAETYLREARAITAPLDGADLGFLPSASVWPYVASCREPRPALVAKVSDDCGRLIGVHLTYLRPDGSAKADVASPRKVAGSRFGGFVRLAPGSNLIVGEGIESALSAWQARPPDAHDFGAIAGICAGGVCSLEWPAATRALIIAPDHDKAGQAAAEALAQRAWAAGLAVSLMWPPGGFADWNDAACAEQLRP